jgi:predicted S18 family serine protease
MRTFGCFIFTAMIAAFAQMAAGAVVGTAMIHAPAVILGNNTGSLTVINLTVTDGRGNVSIVGPAEVAQSTLQSAQTAVYYAAKYLNVNQYNYNFTYDIQDDYSNVSGPSAGAAMTLLAISALSHKPLEQDFTITGTISPNGSIGEIGGVYDKVSAAAASGMKYALVPAVQYGSGEAVLYLLVQETFGIPLIQVSNISDALPYGYGSYRTLNGTSYNFYTDYKMHGLGDANILCSNGCNSSAFAALANFTINFTRNEINILASYPAFNATTAQLSRVLNQSAQLDAKGYYYLAADEAFLDYQNAFYFDNHLVTRSGGLSTLQGIGRFCADFIPPQLTSSNYEYVLGGELRQAWGNYTISSAVSSYNQTGFDTDEVLYEMSNGANANGWCNAAHEMYGLASDIGGQVVTVSPSLNSVALNRIDRALAYGPGLYLSTAETAYKQGNYPLAILDADYAYALSSGANATAAQKYNMTVALESNSSYGIWASQFADESKFYLYESKAANNATNASGYLDQAYSTALLASQMSRDMQAIYGGLEPTGQTIQGAKVNGTAYNVPSIVDFSQVEAELGQLDKLMTALFIVIAGIFIVNTAIWILMIRERRERKAAREGAKREAQAAKQKYSR